MHIRIVVVCFYDSYISFFMAIILGMSKQGPKHQIFVTAEAKANDAAAVKFAKVKPCGFSSHISLDDYLWRSSFSRLKLTQLRTMLNLRVKKRRVWLLLGCDCICNTKGICLKDLSESVKQWEALEQHPATPAENVAKFLQWWTPTKFLDLAIMQIVIVNIAPCPTISYQGCLGLTASDKAGKSSDAFNGIAPWMKSTLESWSCKRKHTICLDCADCC